MFTRQKKNYRVFVYSLLVVTLCLLIASLLWPKDSVPEENRVNAQSETEEKPSEAENENEPIEKDPQVSGEIQQNEDMSQNSQSYYIVRKDGDSICVFFCSEDGSEVKLEETEILYDLLPAEDQKAFEEGIRAEGQEELAALLQDFES